jgi:hypothetical protein
MQELEHEQAAKHMPAFREARVRIEALLNEADLVKFAKLIPEAPKCRQAMDKAREIVRLTRYKLEPEEPEKSGSTNPAPPAPPPPLPSIRTPESKPEDYPTQTFSPSMRTDATRTGVE